MQYRRTERTALAYECYVSTQGHALRKGSVQSKLRDHDTQAVWANDPHPTTARENLLFELDSGSTAFFEAR
jgi:hypothetical protein